jgi:sugar lactone lactonase YvrE
MAHTHCRYFTDSLKNVIYAYDYDDGNISNRRVFADARAQGLPDQTFADGLCIDSEGCIWSARSVKYVASLDASLEHLCRWNGSQIVRFAKDGKIDAEIIFPTVFRVTACCFGG